LVSLQKGTGAEQLVDCGFPVTDFGDLLDEEHGAFMDTAALMTNLDLVVTSDTALAHLAGALGVPVWVALPHVPDWRWLTDREDSPWYPTMRLFRQKEIGNWDAVFQRIAGEVRTRRKSGAGLLEFTLHRASEDTLKRELQQTDNTSEPEATAGFTPAES
jgi:hypothetical protein